MRLNRYCFNFKMIPRGVNPADATCPRGRGGGARVRARARTALTMVLLAMLAPAACIRAQDAAVGAAEAGEEPLARNLILLVTDGGGVGTWTVARLARGAALAVAGMPVVGLVDTRNTDGGLTDSAAGATALATGRRTYNRALSVAPACRERVAREEPEVLRDPASCEPLPTLLELAEAAGKATGLVTTSYLTDATPAAFASHVPSRYMHGPIARQMLDSGVDVLIGGGRRYFQDAAAEAGTDVLAAACRAADCPGDGEALAALPPSSNRLIALLAEESLPPAGERRPELRALARIALERVSTDEDGFFVLIETEGTDAVQHDNAPVAQVEAEIVAFDLAVAEALAWADRVPGTLVVVTGDHETGGLAIVGPADEGRWEARYVDDGHTHGLVPLFAYGPGAERFAGILDNDQVGRLLREMLLGP